MICDDTNPKRRREEDSSPSDEELPAQLNDEVDVEHEEILNEVNGAQPDLEKGIGAIDDTLFTGNILFKIVQTIANGECFPGFPKMFVRTGDVNNVDMLSVLNEGDLAKLQMLQSPLKLTLLETGAAKVVH